MAVKREMWSRLTAEQLAACTCRKTDGVSPFGPQAIIHLIVEYDAACPVHGDDEVRP